MEAHAQLTIEPVMADPELPWRPPRLCDVYWSEFKHCKSMRNRFHHYYAYGTVPECDQWKQDHDTCREWEKTYSTQAKEFLQQSERNRMSEQRKFTPVWEMRQNPPADWHLPLNQEKPEGN